MLQLFKKTPQQLPGELLQVDVHSHLLPGIDDGAETMEQSIELLRGFQKLGYRKVITTPHVMHGYYDNTPEIINGKLAELREASEKAGLTIAIAAAAEYYLDEQFYESLENPGQLLYFGNKYVLMETSYMNEPVYLSDAIFKLQTKGYQPVLAHPERYVYLFDNEQVLERLINQGTIFQVNLNSLSGYYSKGAQKLAERLIKRGVVSLLGSDCHNMKHQKALQEVWGRRNFREALKRPILNPSLL